MIKHSLLLILWSSLGMYSPSPQILKKQTNDKLDLSILVTNIKVKKGSIVVGIYDNPKDYLKKGKAARLSNHIVSGKQLEIKLKSIPKGTYAISIFQDLNADNNLNTNAIGIPIEPYGFSNGFNRKWSQPTFDQCKFELKENKSIQVELIH